MCLYTGEVGVRRGSAADRLMTSASDADNDDDDDARRLSRSQSTSHLTQTSALSASDAAAAAAAAADDDDDVDLVSIQTALRRFSKQLITAEMQRVSRVCRADLACSFD